jgi:hypothetical protein
MMGPKASVIDQQDRELTDAEFEAELNALWKSAK